MNNAMSPVLLTPEQRFAFLSPLQVGDLQSLGLDGDMDINHLPAWGTKGNGRRLVYLNLRNDGAPISVQIYPDSKGFWRLNVCTYEGNKDNSNLSTVYYMTKAALDVPPHLLAQWGMHIARWTISMYRGLLQKDPTNPDNLSLATMRVGYASKGDGLAKLGLKEFRSCICMADESYNGGSTWR